MLRIEYSDRRCENKLYKTHANAVKAGIRAMRKYGARYRIFKEWTDDSFEQLGLFNQEPEY